MKWYKTGTFKLLIIIIPIAIAASGAVYSGISYIYTMGSNETTSLLNQRQTDTLQWSAIQRNFEGLGACNSQIDMIKDKQSAQDILIDKTADQQKKENSILEIILYKIDKTLIPLLKDQQTVKRKLDSITRNNYDMMEKSNFDTAMCKMNLDQNLYDTIFDHIANEQKKTDFSGSCNENARQYIKMLETFPNMKYLFNN